MSDIEMTWKTYDFELNKISELEDEYNFLLREVPKFFAQEKDQSFDELEEELAFPINTPNEEDHVGINQHILAEEFKRVTNNLLHFYNRQASTVADLIKMHSDPSNKIPEGRETSMDFLIELREVTLNLRKMVLESVGQVKNLFDID